MSKKSHGASALKFASGLALCVYAIASHADPISLQGVCSLTSTIPGQGQCRLSYQLGDDYAGIPANVQRSQIRVNGTVVAQYVNDIANPAQFAVPTVSGWVDVACGTSHKVTARIARPLGAGFENVGSLPAVACPTAP